jgi:hypothetical protein
VSKQNVGVGATMSIGYEPEEIGRIGARQLLADWSHERALVDQEILSPGNVLIAVSRAKLKQCKLEIPSGFSRSIDYYHDA